MVFRKHINRTGLTLLGVLSIVAAITLASVHAVSAAQANNLIDTNAIHSVAFQAAVDDQTLAIAPSSKIVQSASGVESTDLSAPSAATMQQMDAHIDKIYSQTYSGPLLTKKSAAVKGAIRRFAGEHVLYIGGGVTSIVYRSLSIKGTTATLVYYARIWAKMASIAANGQVGYSQPTGGITTTLTLTKVSGKWVIMSEMGIPDPI